MTMHLCECRCGEPAPLAKITNARLGWVKGQPVRFVHGHSGRTQGQIRDRLLAKTVIDLAAPRTVDDSPCWIWTGNSSRGGYGQIRYAGRMAYTHRIAYELWFGPIPGGLPGAKRGSGLDIDHLCFNRLCINPGHLEAVTHLINNRRSTRYGAAGVGQR